MKNSRLFAILTRLQYKHITPEDAHYRICALLGVSISSWGGLIQKLRDKYGCIIWISPISSQETEKVIGWSFECEWLLFHNKEPNMYQDHIWHESANVAEEAAVKWACKELKIEVSALANFC